MSGKEHKLNFSEYLNYFPAMELPLLLTEEAHHEFSKVNDPLPKAAIEQFILPYEDLVYDEFTEYIPCFQIPNTHEFYAIVYFKASLLIYEYYLVTYDKQGKQIAKEKIAGMVTKGDELNRAAATIEKDWVIHIVEGSVRMGSSDYKPTDSKSYAMELLPDGQIIFSVNEDVL